MSGSSETTIGARGGVRRFVGLGLFLAVSFVGLIVLGEARPRRDPPAAPREEPLPARFAKHLDVSDFQKGNLHTHSNVSDGDVPPVDVFLWYRDNGYNFVALTDHNTIVDPKPYAHLERPDFRIMAGEEITMSGAGRQVHVNGLCVKSVIQGGAFDTARHALDHATSEIGKQGGVALVNHPNFDLGLTADDVVGTHGASLLEVWSGHPYVYTLGTDGRPSHEALWVKALDAGVDLAPAGVDDAHHFRPHVTGKKAARPGRAWVQVFADRPDPALLCDKIRAGELYASNGAELDRLSVDGDVMRIWPEAMGATVEFVGAEGKVLAVARPDAHEPASYVLRGDEAYVRARVIDADGKLAFTPAFRVLPPEVRAR